MLFHNKTVFVTGASRGIGKAIALKLAAAGANIVIAAKSVTEHPLLGGTIYSAAAEIEQAGGRAFPVACDIRDEAMVQNAVAKAVGAFGGIDILINNASAIALTNTQDTVMKRYDLMYDINVRGTFMVTKYCLPHLAAGDNPHILTLSPPVNIDVQWLAPHVAYTLSKYNMSLMTLGWAEEFRSQGIAANALWPVTTIATAAVKNLLGGDTLIQRSRKPEILADAASHILQQDAKTCTGNLFLDEEVLRAMDITDFSSYAVTPGGELQRDLFI